MPPQYRRKLRNGISDCRQPIGGQCPLHELSNCLYVIINNKFHFHTPGFLAR
jgi:hypothetical protein